MFGFNKEADDQKKRQESTKLINQWEEAIRDKLLVYYMAHDAVAPQRFLEPRNVDDRDPMISLGTIPDGLRNLVTTLINESGLKLTRGWIDNGGIMGAGDNYPDAISHEGLTEEKLRAFSHSLSQEVVRLKGHNFMDVELSKIRAVRAYREAESTMIVNGYPKEDYVPPDAAMSLLIEIAGTSLMPDGLKKDVLTTLNRYKRAAAMGGPAR